MKNSKLFLEQLKKIPIVSVAAEKTGLSRQTIYRWRKENKEFAKAMETALKEGIEFVNDMSESQLLTLIQAQEWHAIQFWLRHHHSTYRNKVEVTTIAPQEELTPEQEKVVREALRLASLPVNSLNNENINQDDSSDSPRSSSDSTGTDGKDDERSDSSNSNN